jgi:nicotinamidase-related amidase
MPVIRLNADRLAIVLVDAQPYFFDRMHGDAEQVLARLEQLLIVADWFALPVVATLEEPVAEKGELHERLRRVFPASGRTFCKHCFDLCAEPTIEAALSELGRDQFALAGGETDVCVLQSALGLLSRGREVFLLEDGLFSSEAQPRPALERMYQAGAVACTYKTLYYELLGTVAPDGWQPQREAAVARGFVDVESLPPWRPGR